MSPVPSAGGKNARVHFKHVSHSTCIVVTQLCESCTEAILSRIFFHDTICLWKGNGIIRVVRNEIVDGQNERYRDDLRNSSWNDVREWEKERERENKFFGREQTWSQETIKAVNFFLSEAHQRFKTNSSSPIRWVLRRARFDNQITPIRSNSCPPYN